jgi:hypothetical protein
LFARRAASVALRRTFCLLTLLIAVPSAAATPSPQAASTSGDAFHAPFLDETKHWHEEHALQQWIEELKAQLAG